MRKRFPHERWSFFHSAMALAWEGCAVTRIGELSHFYHVAVAADKVGGHKNYNGLHVFAEASSVAPRTYSLRRGNLDFVVFCFSKQEDAQAFYEQFGGERLVPHLRSSGDNVPAPPRSVTSGLEAALRPGSDQAQREEIRRVVRPQKPHPTADEHRALQLLAGSRCGAAEEALVVRHGFKLPMLAGLVRAKLARRCRVTVKAGARTIGVTYMIITAAGRKAIKGF
jgi:hypothetical protein